MNEPIDPLDPSGPGELPELLRWLEADESQVPPDRARTRAEVLATFDAAVVGNSGPVSRPEPRPEIVELLADEDRPAGGHRMIERRRISAWVVAAALVVASLGALALLPRNWTQTSADRPDQPRLVQEGSNLPAELVPGPQITTVIGSRLSFDAPEGLVVEVESEGRVVLRGLDQALAEGRIVIAELDVDDFEAELQTLTDDGRISVKNLGATVGGETTSRWDIVITNDELARVGCEMGRPCLALPGGSDDGAASLLAGADNRVFEIGRSDGTIVVLIDQSLAFSGPISTMASEILATLDLRL